MVEVVQVLPLVGNHNDGGCGLGYGDAGGDGHSVGAAGEVVLVVMLVVMAMVTVVQVLVFLVDGQTNSHKRVSGGEQ